jgi:hypothetical protein
MFELVYAAALAFTAVVLAIDGHWILAGIVVGAIFERWPTGKTS